MDSSAKKERQPRHEELFIAVNECLSNAAGKLEALRDTIAGLEKPLTTGEGSDPGT